MAGFGFGNVGFVGSLGGGAAAAPASVNRALQFVAASSQYADLALPGAATALSGATWSLEFRVRLDALAGGSYLISRAPAGGNDQYAIFYNFVANKLEFFYGPNNLRLALTTATPPATAYLTVLFAYNGTSLTGSLNGVVDVTFTGALAALTADGLLRFGARADASVNNPASVTLDYVKITNGGAVTVLADFNEAAPPYANAGTAGGSFTLSTSAPTSILV